MSHGDDFGGGLHGVSRSPEPGGFARLGADLRAARERLGWTLAVVAAYLRIKLAYLQAIEDGRIADLPGNAYAIGFVRAYAQTLGLNSDDVARRFRAEAAQVNRQTELDFPVPVPQRGVPALAVVAVGLVLAVGAYAGWYRYSGNDRAVSDTVQPVPDRLAALAEKTPAEPADAVPPAAIVASAPPAASPAVQPDVAPVGPPAPIPAPAVVTEPAAVVAPPPAIHPDGPRIVLRATAEAWVQVRDKQTGEVLLNRLLKPGETWPVPPRPLPLLLTAGNVSGTELLVDGVPAPPFGVEGHVLRDLPLDPDALKVGKVAANAPRQPPHNP